MRNTNNVYDNYKDLTKVILKALKNSDNPIVVAFDGRSGTGKSTIAKKIEGQFNCVNITMDNYYVGGSDEYWDSLTPQKRMETVIDWNRMKIEVLTPLLKGKVGKLQSYNWQLNHGLSPEIKTLLPKKLIILDGAYSTRPELLNLINLSVLFEVPTDNYRRQRLIGREGEKYMTNWHCRWDPAEDYFFTKIRPRESFDLIFINK